MHDLTTLPSTDPLAIYRYRDGLYAADLLGAALVEFDFFTRLAAAPATLEAVCARHGWQRRPADVALTLFAANGFVREEGGVFHATALARDFLVREAACFVGPYYAALRERPVLQDYIKVLRTGRPANFGSAAVAQDWHRAMEDEAFAERFTAAMDCRGTLLGPALAARVDFSRHTRVLDVAGGSGIYACALVARHPHLRATVLEKPPVDGVARRAIARRGSAERVTVAAGEMFRDAWPGDCDVHLLSNVLHDWDEPEVRALLAKSAAALPPGGVFLSHDMHLNAAKDGPLDVAEYSALLMNITQGRCYSTGELGAWLGELGFGNLALHPTAAGRSVFVAEKLR